MGSAAGYDDDLAFAIALADSADAMTMAAYTGEAIEFEDKLDGSPVTEHDRLVEERLRAMIAERRPGDGFVGEETGTTDGSGDGSGRRWIIDPIDGTASFIRGGRSWATQIALDHDGDLVVGVTSAPAINARWWAGAGVGAFRRTARDSTAVPLHVSSTGRLRDATWVSYPPLHRLADGASAPLDRLGEVCAYTRPTAHGALMVAGGETDVCFQLAGGPWDYAAFAALVRAAGGAFTYLDGEARIADGGMAAALFSNGRIHGEALALLQAS